MNSHQPLKTMLHAHALAFSTCTPWFATIELGLQCNLTCTHCYNFDRRNPIPEKLKISMPTSRILILIDELKEAGSLMIAFSGGEALMHPHIFDFIKRARENHLLVKIKSNGTLVNKHLAKKLYEYGVSDFDISVYGANSIEHDWLTNKSGSFEKTIQGIRNLKNNKIPTVMNFIIHQKNYQSISEMIKLANDLECTFTFSSEMTKRYDNTSPQDEVGITKDQFSEILKSENGDYFNSTNEEENLQCECARTVCAINHQGDVFPCIGAPIISGNILNDSFLNIWKNSKEFEKIRGIERDSFTECSKCNLIKFCSRSSGGAYVNTGNYLGPNPENCMEAEARKVNSSF
jgi:radical SAM protein with 4Fe4S-binding SPASM domain